MVPMPFCFPRKEAKQCPSLLTVVLLPNKKVLCLFLKSLFCPSHLFNLVLPNGAAAFRPSRCVIRSVNLGYYISIISASAVFAESALSPSLSLSLSLSQVRKGRTTIPSQASGHADLILEQPQNLHTPTKKVQYRPLNILVSM